MKSHRMKFRGGVLVEQIRWTSVKGNNTVWTEGLPFCVRGNRCKLVMENSRLKLWKMSLQQSNFWVAGGAETWMCLKMKPEKFSGWCPSNCRHSKGKLTCSYFLWWVPIYFLLFSYCLPFPPFVFYECCIWLLKGSLPCSTHKHWATHKGKDTS